MPTDLIIPEIGESITEVEIGQIMAPEGTAVSKDDPILEIETDKVTLELPAPVDGVVGKLTVKQGDQAQVGDNIGVIEEGEGKGEGKGQGGSGSTASASASSSSARAEASAVGSTDNASSNASSNGNSTATQDAPASGESTGDTTVMPAAKRLLDENNLDASQVTPTGPGGRLLKEDVQNYLQSNGSGSKPGSGPSSASQAAKQPIVHEAAPGAKSQTHAATSGGGGREVERQRMTKLRRQIAKNLVQAQQTAALLTTFNEVDMSAVMDLRKQYQDQFVKKYDIKLGFMSFFVKAVIDGLKSYPSVNAEIDGEDVLYKNFYDIGIAVGGGKGLVVPVIRNAERLSFAEVEQTIADLGKRAKDGKLELSELQGGTFTITNGGIYGSMLSTPIINPPQSGVLGMHNIVKRAVVNPQTDAIEVKPMMYLALSYDHRLVDGREAVSFLVQVKQNIEDPTRMLVEV